MVNRFNEAIECLEREDYLTNGYALYELLISPIKDYLNNIRQLIIVPAGSLYYLPFEALVCKRSQSKSYCDLPYLVPRYDVCYHYSATLLHHGQSQQKQHKFKLNNYLGVAPIYKAKTKIEAVQNTSEGIPENKELILDTLIHSEEEVQSVGKMLEEFGLEKKLLLDKAATIQRFKQSLLWIQVHFDLCSSSITRKADATIRNCVVTFKWGRTK